MSERIILAAVVVVCLLAGWLVGSAGSAAAQETEQARVSQCFEFYQE